MPDGPGVLLQVARGPALVGAVEERDELFPLHDRADLFPLVGGGVGTSGVVSLDRTTLLSLLPPLPHLSLLTT